jgi:hypothetical protein
MDNELNAFTSRQSDLQHLPAESAPILMVSSSNS